MDFRCWILSLFICTFSLVVHADELDRLAIQLYQFPSQADERIQQLEKNNNFSDTDKLRLQLLKCQVQLQLGENKASIAISQTGQRRANNSKLDFISPYFQICEAEAYSNLDQLKSALVLLDTNAEYAKRKGDYQLLFSILRNRSEIEYNLNNFSAALEDLRLAIDIYPEIHLNGIKWSAPPLAYVLADMAAVLITTGDLTHATEYMNQAMEDPVTVGKVKHVLLLMQARLSIERGDYEVGEKLLKQAKDSVDTLKAKSEIAQSYVQISYLSLVLDDVTEAEKYGNAASEIYQQLGNKTQKVSIRRLLARIKMKQGDLPKAEKLYRDSIHLSISTDQPNETATTTQLLATLLAKEDRYQEAYHLLQQSVDAMQKAQDRLNSTQFMQYKAKLSLQEQQQSLVQQKIKAATNDNEQKLKQAYSIIYVLLFGLLALAFWMISKYKNWQPQTKKLNSDDGEQWAESMISNAKNAGYPLSVLIININHIKQIDLPKLTEELTHRLREQDKIMRHSVDELLVVLPHTSAEGATRVVRQLEPVITMFQMQHISIGLAEMKQPDNLQSLAKRASINQLSRAKELGRPYASHK